MNRDLDDIGANYINAENDFIIAETDRRIVGTGALIQESNDIRRKVRVSVMKTMRNRGIGAVNGEYLIKLDRKRKLKQIVFETNLNWLAANSLYRRFA